MAEHESVKPVSANAAYSGTGSNDELWPILTSHGAVTDPSDVRDSYLATVLINWRNAACKDVADQYQAMKTRAGQAEVAVAVLGARLATAGGEPDLSGWSAEENAEFEKLYGIQAAMRLRAANDRTWAVVQELRDEAVKAGRDPYQDPMARRLSAALVGADGA